MQKHLIFQLNDTDTQNEIEKQGTFEWVVPVTFHTNELDIPVQSIILNKSNGTF